MPVGGSAAVTSKYVSDSHHFLVSITWWHFPFLSLLVNLDINLLGSSHVPFYHDSVRVRLSFPVLWGPSAQSLGRRLPGCLVEALQPLLTLTTLVIPLPHPLPYGPELLTTSGYRTEHEFRPQTLVNRKLSVFHKLCLPVVGGGLGPDHRHITNSQKAVKWISDMKTPHTLIVLIKSPGYSLWILFFFFCPFLSPWDFWD